VKAPTRALIVEDIQTWAYTLDRAARRAGASEVVVCSDLDMVREALRKARFDVAILDVGLDPDDDLNSDGVNALEAIRAVDGGSTRCVLVTGWQGGDLLDLHADAQQRFGVDWAYMKDKYEAHAVIAKLTELLEQALDRRLSQGTPMANLSADAAPLHFEDQLIGGLSPTGGVKTLYALASRLLSAAIPLVAISPDAPMEKGADGVWTGMYWSRSLSTAVAVALGPASGWQEDESIVPTNLVRLLSDGVAPDLIESVRERNIRGRLWELPGIDRDGFPG
jgi:CheY-like chemotaxis protein